MKQLAGKILGGRYHISKRVELVEITELELRHDLAIEESIQIGKIADHPGFRGGLSAYGDFDFVIVPVSMRIVAFAVHAAVLLLAELGRVQPVRRAKLISAGEICLHASP